ncbi:DNA-(apurinic or apyrimidinic site) lyase APN2 [Ascoidea rubescens DSM 1968]|uniref:DNA-(apurinic or apyrimidinic site) endonuclease 2 n=1 Tax=Ascoidea rubescens DSM 1968 TaxID=1344418 RepID=A0A1D2VQ49_9ASCO|nr:DNase I-like protein [Ascoidea rubescens DSM 1968]ODV63714.1 DNase I-like protein [Ascoidea rubescens DSM 1968]
MSSAVDVSVVEQVLKNCYIPSKATANTIRVLSFNVNGIRTLFNYHPWSSFSKNMSFFYKFLKADIISLQELKINKENVSASLLPSIDDYYSFISLPTSKKGYSGIGLYVRKPTEDDSPMVENFLRIKKCEEGITGLLPCYDYNPRVLNDNVKKNRNRLFSYKELYENSSIDYSFKETSLIGGYPDLNALSLSVEEALELDSQGRCLILELNLNLIIISLYCPANSLNSEDGLNFKYNFIRVLIQRIKILKKTLNKEVLIMGDINISRDLFDRADSLNEYLLIKDSQTTSNGNPTNINACNIDNFNFDKDYLDSFIKSDISRILLNSIIINSNLTENVKIDKNLKVIYQNNAKSNLLILDNEEISDNGSSETYDTISLDKILYDVIREKHGNKLKLYTCWNTQLNHRPINYGSRIDFILTSQSFFDNFFDTANLLTHLYGSDHCPIYSDFTITEKIYNNNNNSNSDHKNLTKSNNHNFPKLEANTRYKLNKISIIDSLFKKPSFKTSILFKQEPLVIENNIETDKDIIKKSNDSNINNNNIKSNYDKNGNTKIINDNNDNNDSENDGIFVVENIENDNTNNADNKVIKVNEKPKLNTLALNSINKFNASQPKRKYVYMSRKLTNNIDTNKSKTPYSDKKTTVQKKNKRQKPIESFFKPISKIKEIQKQNDNSLFMTDPLVNSNYKIEFIDMTNDEDDKVDSSITPNNAENKSDSSIQSQKSFNMNTKGVFEGVYGKPPVCKHNDKCVLKTCKNTKNKGKKFWCCSRTSNVKNHSEVHPDINCGFFKWVN